LFYALNGTTYQAFWLSSDWQPDTWISSYIPLSAIEKPMPEIFGDHAQYLRSSPAPVMDLPAPKIEVLADKATGHERVVKLKIKSQRYAPKLKLSIEGHAINDVKIAGQDYAGKAFSGDLDVFGFGSDELSLEFKTDSGHALTVRAMDFTYGLAMATNPRPADTIASPGEYSDTTVVVNAINF
jgi:hypothetical protein